MVIFYFAANWPAGNFSSHANETGAWFSWHFLIQRLVVLLTLVICFRADYVCVILAGGTTKCTTNHSVSLSNGDLAQTVGPGFANSSFRISTVMACSSRKNAVKYRGVRAYMPRLNRPMQASDYPPFWPYLSPICDESCYQHRPVSILNLGPITRADSHAGQYINFSIGRYKVQDVLASLIYAYLNNPILGLIVRGPYFPSSMQHQHHHINIYYLSIS